MFGEEYRIVRYFPEYFLDYREVLDPTIRWTDRIQSSSGEWSGNLFDFFFRVYNRLSRDLPKPFVLNGVSRVEDTPTHKAIREALANCIVNADFYLPRGLVILKEQDRIIMQNPGSIRTGKDQMLRGGISDPRNKAIMKMLNLLMIGERAGSGVPNIFSVWEDNKWDAPVIEEQYGPDRTILTLPLSKKSAITPNNTQLAPDGTQLAPDYTHSAINGSRLIDDLIISHLKSHPTDSQSQTAKAIDKNINTVKKAFSRLKSAGILAWEGKNNRIGNWIIKSSDEHR